MENKNVFEEERIDSDELSHWGIKGMKWGVRRYQNKDGSLTPAGKKRRAQLESELEKLDGKSDKGGAAKSKSKTVKDMTDEELRAAVNRLQLEKQYRDLNVKKVTAGKKFIDKLTASALDGVAEAGKTILKDALVKSGKEALGLDGSNKKGKS